MSSPMRKRAYQRHKYAGIRKSSKISKSALRRIHGIDNRSSIWRAEEIQKKLNPQIIPDNSTDTQNTLPRTYSRVKPKISLQATNSVPITSTVTAELVLEPLVDIEVKDVLPQPASEEVSNKENNQTDDPAPSMRLINIKPINELITAGTNDSTKETQSFHVIQSFVNLEVESPQNNPTYPVVRQNVKPTENCFFKYEEVQAKVILNKHRVVLGNMMVKDNLIKVYKCAGRFCSFSSDSADDAFLHAFTHQRIGGIDALNCSYCDFDAKANAIDLVMHVFKEHGHCQYSCQQCFYRAASSQAVAAHARRLHGITLDEVIVLRSTVATNTPDEGEVLTPEEAVQSYVCQLQDNGGICNFHSYTPDEFCEHILQKHPGATTHSCYVCHKETSSTMELIDHMKSHGIQLYQCAWCVLGADSQDDLLAHVSIAHPTKQPQAYLRIVTSNGPYDLRVLPLSFLNKLEVPTEDVTPSAAKENPVREAERSIDLEKLISLTMAMDPQLKPEPTPEQAEDPHEHIPEAVQPSVPPLASVVPVVTIPEVQAEVFPPVSNIVPIAGPSQTNISDNHPLLHTPVVTVAVDPLLTISKVPIKPPESTNWTLRRSPRCPRSRQTEVEAPPAPAKQLPVAGSSGEQAFLKRARLDDTQSPRSDAQRGKPMATLKREVSSADASESHLQVAIVTVPPRDLTQTQTEQLRAAINESVLQTILANTPAPSFRGRPFYLNGVLAMWCEDESALSWLEKTVKTLASPIPGTTLAVIRQSDIQERQPAGLLLHTTITDPATLHKAIRAQNPWYKVDTWQCYNITINDLPDDPESKEKVVHLILGIPENQKQGILDREQRVSHMSGSGYLQFFINEKAPQPAEGAQETDRNSTPGPSTSAPRLDRDEKESLILLECQRFTSDEDPA